MIQKYFLSVTCGVFLIGCVTTKDLSRDDSGLNEEDRLAAIQAATLTKQRCVKRSNAETTSKGVQIEREALIARLFKGNSGWYKAEARSSGAIDYVYYNVTSREFVCGEKNWNMGDFAAITKFRIINPSENVTRMPQNPIAKDAGVKTIETKELIALNKMYMDGLVTRESYEEARAKLLGLDSKSLLNEPTQLADIDEFFNKKVQQRAESQDNPVTAVHPTKQLPQGRGSKIDGRVALVIGNAAYKVSPLANPVNDATDVAERLRKLNFLVVERRNITTKQIGSTLATFRSTIKPGDVALVFYAGHGMQIKGQNYLPAVDADIIVEEDVPSQSLSTQQIMDVLADSGSSMNLVFLDACRDNPYARSFRSAARGLSRENAPSGTLISYATRPGSVAADGTGRNGLYTSILLKAMEMESLPIEQVLKQVVRGVTAASNGAQEPWMEGSLVGDFCFGRCE